MGANGIFHSSHMTCKYTQSFLLFFSVFSFLRPTIYLGLGEGFVLFSAKKGKGNEKKPKKESSSQHRRRHQVPVRVLLGVQRDLDPDAQHPMPRPGTCVAHPPTIGRYPTWREGGGSGSVRGHEPERRGVGWDGTQEGMNERKKKK